MTEKKYVSNEKIVSELKKIYKKNGGIIRAEDVVEGAASLNAGHPLHDYFNWNDQEAAHKYRVEQARELLRITVEYMPTGKGDYTRIRVFNSLTPDRKADGGGYRTTIDIMSDGEMSKRMLQDALDELHSFKRKYENIKELSGVFAEIDKISSKKPMKKAA